MCVLRLRGFGREGGGDVQACRKHTQTHTRPTTTAVMSPDPHESRPSDVLILWV